MKKDYGLVIIGLLILVLVSGAQSGEQRGLLDYSQSSRWLVKAVVEDLNSVTNQVSDCSFFEAKLKISHVYFGPTNIFGTTFSCGTANLSLFSGPFFVEPLLVLHEEVICCVKDRKPSLLMLLFPFMGVNTPSRSRDPLYKQDELLANAIEQVCQISGLSNQVAVTKKYIFHELPEVSAWAVRTLGNSTREEDGNYLSALVDDKKLSICGCIALDGVLQIRMKDEWNASPRRVEFLKRLIRAELNEADALAVARFLSQMDSHDPMGYVGIAKLIKIAIENKRISGKARDTIFDTLDGIALKKLDNGEALQMCIDEIRGEGSSRMNAAGTVWRCAPLNGGQIAIVRELKDQVRDKVLKLQLEKILEVRVPFSNTWTNNIGLERELFR